MMERYEIEAQIEAMRKSLQKTMGHLAWLEKCLKVDMEDSK